MPNPFIYAIDPIVEASVHITGGTTPASGGSLKWYRHLGREDGSFEWEGPRKVGTGWGNFKHVFSGGNGIIYAVDPIVEASVHVTGGTTPASGGNLWWYRHVGREDGSFRWEGPKKVGTGWGNFKHIFSGGDGIIYAVDPIVEASVHVTGGTTPASGGNLWWYRHVGREDGSFIWEGPKKVGTRWGTFKYIFSGDDGIIYAVDPIVEASVHVTGGTTPASGGSLWWYHHLGREDGSFRWTFNEGKKVGTGWGGFLQLFSGGDGIIYTVDPIVEASVHITGGTTQASGGDLRWYRHLGRDAGTFKWDGPKKVGTGWGSFLQVFSGGRDLVVDIGHVRFCGVPDSSDGSGGIHITTFGAPSGRWSRGNLTFNVNISGLIPQGPLSLSQADVNTIITAAFMQWQTVVPFFTFNQVLGSADITIQFGGSALDSRFGATGGVTGVGHAPEDGRLFFDSSEGWNKTAASQQKLLSVALHEIGHVLGLRHSTSSSSLMYPYRTQNSIDNETIEAINGLYGWQPQTPLNDRGSIAGPSLATAGITSFTNSSNQLYMAWRGVADDDRIYWSVFENNRWSTQRTISDSGSSHGPALATGFNNGGVTGLFMAWDGVPGDDAIYFATNANPIFQDWSDQQRIDNVGTSARPALAMFKGQMHMAWKGVPGDSAIYWSRFDGNGWISQAPIPGRGTSDGPALAVLGNRLFMFWKGIDGDNDAYFSWLDDEPAAIWQVQRKIAYTEAQTQGNVDINIGTSGQPVATTHRDSIVLAWKGVPGDTGIYFSRFRDNEDKEWSGQTNMAGIGTSNGPALASLNGRLFMAWRGIPGDTGLYFSWLG